LGVLSGNRPGRGGKKGGLYSNDTRGLRPGRGGVFRLTPLRKTRTPPGTL
jgi:hypothetical protein